MTSRFREERFSYDGSGGSYLVRRRNPRPGGRNHPIGHVDRVENGWWECRLFRQLPGGTVLERPTGHGKHRDEAVREAFAHERLAASKAPQRRSSEVAP